MEGGGLGWGGSVQRAVLQETLHYFEQRECTQKRLREGIIPIHVFSVGFYDFMVRYSFFFKLFHGAGGEPGGGEALQ